MTLSRLLLIIVLIVGGYFAYQKWGGEAKKAAEETFGAHFGKGQAYFQLERYEDAIKELQKAIDLDPKDSRAPDAMRRMGDCYSKMKQNAKAIEVYQQVVDKYPDYTMRTDVQNVIEKLKLLGGGDK